MAAARREYVCRATYLTPLGHITSDLRAATEEEALSLAKERNVFGVVELERTCTWVEVDGERVEGRIDLAESSCDHDRDERADDAAEDRGAKPADSDGEVLGPEPVTPGEHVEPARNGDPSLGADALEPDPVPVEDVRVEHELVLVVCKRNETKFLKLGKHRLLVDGLFFTLGLEGPFEVANLARVLADSPEVGGEVGRD